MRVLFIFWPNPGDPTSSTLSKELAEEFSRQGHQVTAVIPSEKKYNKPTRLVQEEYYTALYVKTGNFFNLESKLEKILTTFTIGKSLLNGIMQHLASSKFDLIITRAPFLANPKLISALKTYFNCPADLLLFDIFPQTAWDLGIIKSKLVYNYFKYREKKELEQFSAIWCTSPGNAKYMLERNKYLQPGQLSWMYNYGIIKEKPQINRAEMRKSIGFSDDDVIALFGGNMGTPQKLENLLNLAQKTLPIKNAKFLFVGIGTERKRIEQMAQVMHLSNVKFIDYLPREKYELIVSSCDIGLISLNQDFTIPNFPSKTTDYYKLGVPILASLDKVSITDFGDLIQNQIHGGLYAAAGDTEALYQQYLKLYNDPQLRKSMGENGRKFYEREQDVSKACKKIVEKFYKGIAECAIA